MIHAYNEIYLNDAMKCLGSMLEFAVMDIGYEPDVFFKMFIDSTISHKFELGNASIISGRSGPELAAIIIKENEFNSIKINPSFSEDKSDIYWSGWIMAYFQWYKNLSFQEIWKYITIKKLQKLYYPLHEADIMKTIELLEKMMVPKENNNIRNLRLIKGLTQAAIAKEAKITVSQLQRLEYGQRKVENLSLKTALSLAKALNVEVTQLK